MSERVLEMLQKIMIKQDKMQQFIKMQNTQISELLQRQQILDQILNRVEKKIDVFHQDNLFETELTRIQPQHSIPSKEYYQMKNSFEENPQKPKKAGILLSSSSNSVLRTTMRSTTSEDSLKKRKLFSIPKNILESKVMLRVHEQNVCLHNFKYEENRIIAKANGWYQLLMKKQIDTSKKQFFQIKIIETFNKCIMMGLASLDRVKCTSSFESGKAIALYLWNNYIYSNRGKEKKSQTKHVKNGDIIKVEVIGLEIKWYSNGQVISQSKIAPELKLCPLVPYIQMCHQGDQIQLR